MKYVLDTMIVSALMSRRQPATQRVALVSPADVGVPQPVFAEIAYGVDRLPASKRKSELSGRFEQARSQLQIVPWTDDVTDEFGRIKTSLERLGIRLEDFDVAVAAHALAFGAVLVTANSKHMSRVRGLGIEDWLAEP